MSLEHKQFNFNPIPTEGKMSVTVNQSDFQKTHALFSYGFDKHTAPNSQPAYGLHSLGANVLIHVDSESGLPLKIESDALLIDASLDKYISKPVRKLFSSLDTQARIRAINYDRSIDSITQEAFFVIDTMSILAMFERNLRRRNASSSDLGD